MTDYTITDGQFYKVLDKDTGAVITMGELSDTNTLSTIHNVEFISEEQYEAERPKPEALSETKMI
ncbi:hypothetical protein ACT4VK_08870 [Acinetobacter baumannii]|uniref:Uncharacterized protein n=1 Tax=Acinetobacter baumannii TaxID=470 RepID=A0A5P1A7U6_ACIBA|nr:MULTISPECIES: hypothetical protein [Acinetobacter]CAH1069511.1 Uncharacterised protein [Acinetobacter phage MD-2021a]HAI54359.1 hypothetical protein [Acinetobacter nosocomialis]ARG36242.1 hypothetical protein B7L46_15465 [Acinetobacter baumannii]AVN29174.1 hypothetical protein AM467_06970 [Acinetobacter baumannii]EHU1617204.1 hypothetical protein [Acinetobacter baumannii]